jgi:subtilase family serine protease
VRKLFHSWIMPVIAVTMLVAVTATASSAQFYKPGTITHDVVSGQLVEHNTPGYVTWARNLGPANPSTVIDVSVWLNVHNRAGLDALASSLYDRTSPTYRHWLKPAAIAARFGPTSQEAATVENFLESHNLRVVWVGPGNFFLRARGTVVQVQSAFHVQLNNYQVAGKVIRANSSDPYIEGPSASLVSAVYGLDSGAYQPQIVTRPMIPAAANSTNPLTSSLALVSPDFFTSNCFVGLTTQSYASTGNTYPKATYTGNFYDSTNPGCSYTPPELDKAFNLNGLFAEGYNGAGQTISIMEGCGSLTIQHDANAFSARFGLPLLTSSNFHVVQVPYASSCAGPFPEENLDVEWAHAAAPGANIYVIVAPSTEVQDLDEAEFYAVNYDLGNVISESYGYLESFTPLSILLTQNFISEVAAITGISTNIASGDGGNYSYLGIPPTVLDPADSPWATAVGGTSLALKGEDSIAWQSGWGTYETVLDDQGTIFDPPCQPFNCGFFGGSTGGPSAVYAKPPFQYGVGVPGAYRQVPDVSWLADPFTGVVISLTEPLQYPPLVWEDVGGTSVAAPMFSGLWAIANQEAGMPLGQAAQYVYHLPAAAITDIVPVRSAHNVTATIHDSPTVTHHYSPSQVMGVSGPFYSALWDIPVYQDYVTAVSFGTDLGLHTNVGWDNVTGVGVPNPKPFADAFKP